MFVYRKGKGNIRTKIINYDEDIKINLLLNSGNQSNQAYVTSMNKALIHLKNSNFNLKILRETFRTHYCGWKFEPNNLFFEVINEKFMQLFESGIVEHIKKDFEKITTIETIDLTTEPKILLFNNFDYVFIAFLVALHSALLVFLAELISKNLKLDAYIILKKAKSCFKKS